MIANFFDLLLLTLGRAATGLPAAVCDLGTAARAGYPLRVEYDLTPAGLRLVPLIDALGEGWEELQPAKSEAA